MNVSRPSTALPPGVPAPAFDLPRLGGGRATLLDLVPGGRPAVLAFFKTECPTCKLAFPFLERMWRRFQAAGDGRIGFLAVAQNPLEELPAFLQGYGATFPVASELDPYAVSDAYGITNVPTIFTLDDRGVITRTSVGFARSELDAVTAEATELAGSRDAASIFGSADSGVPILQPG